MKRIPLVFATISVLMLACNLSSALPGSQASAATSTAPLPPASSTAPLPQGTNTVPVPAATVAPTAPAPNVTCSELSFYLDPKLASSDTCTTVPASPSGIMVYPQYTQVTLTGYVLPNETQEEIDVFSVQAWKQISPNGINSFLSQIQALVAGGTPGDTLPYLLTPPAAQVIYAKYRVLSVPSGSGIRYLTAYFQNQVPIDRHDLFYTYQGVTQDGQFVIAVRLPVLDPILPANNNLPSGQTTQQFDQNWPTYIAATKVKLDAQRELGFLPSLVLLDSLVNSIRVQP